MPLCLHLDINSDWRNLLSVAIKLEKGKASLIQCTVCMWFTQYSYHTNTCAAPTLFLSPSLMWDTFNH